MPAEGGPAVQLTRGGGEHGRELDGRELYFERGGSVWRASLSGTGETEVLRGFSTYIPTLAGIYYVTQRWKTPLRRLDYDVNFLEFASGRRTVLATAAASVGPALVAVSPDESWILLQLGSAKESELMLVENFR